MARDRRWLYREFTRHSVASLIAGVFAGLAVAIHAAGGGRLDQVGTTVVALTLVFGAYGPAFLWLSSFAFAGLSGDPLRARVRRSEERSRFVRWLYLGGPRSWALLIVLIGVVSVVLLATRGDADLLVLASCVVGVVGTWVLLVAIFAIEHMRGWAERGGLAFPGEGSRGFADFVYLSVQLSTTFSSADVALETTDARRLATLQSVVAFAYNAVVIAVLASLLVSIAG
ncbi:DUF1345 domain-containing protein [Agrococcus terreus]|uniref:DUF1345 domain-containing protein n=1 Tax=Agrococcus terreus TaxID=574649 RepID=UPI00384B65D9